MIHAVLFGALAWVTQRRFGRGLPWVLAYACLSEVLQNVLPIGRDGGVADALADVTGALAAWSWSRRHRQE